MEHLTLGCSMDPELIQMDFAIDLPEVGSIVHHNNRYGLVHASAAGSTSTLVSNMAATNRVAALVDDKFQALRDWLEAQPNGVEDLAKLLDRKRVVEGKGVSVRVDLGGRRIIKKKTQKN